MTFELGKTYIVDVTEKGIIPQEVFDKNRWYDKDHDDLDFLTDEEKIIVINDVLDKIRAEIEEYKSRQLTLAIGVEDLEKGKQIALEYVLVILDKYKAESEKSMSDNFEAQPTDAVKCDCTTEEIAKSFTEDVEAVKDQLDGQPTNITVEMHPKEAIEILEYKGTAYNIRRESEE